MPSVLGAAVTAAIGVALKAVTVTQALLSVALAGISYLLTPKPAAPDFSGSQRAITVTVRTPVGPREIVYGKRRKGGVLVFAGESDANKFLHLVVALAGHECEAIEEVYFNDELAFNAAGTAQGRFVGNATLTKHLGADTQVADSGLIAALPGVWTEDHRLRGICYIYVRLTFNADVYRNVPNITAIVKGKKIFDPRTSLTVWSDNAALCEADYLNDSRYGLGAPYGTEIDNPVLIAAANVSDELVQIPAGQTEKRYTCNGIVSSAEEPQGNIQGLLSTMQGTLIYSGGFWIIKAGAFEVPTVTLDENDLRGNLQVQARVPRRELFNAVRGVFVSPKNDWQPADFPPFVSSTFQTQDNGEQIWHDIALPFTTTETMAQRLAKIELFRNREQIAVGYPCSLKALQLRAGDTVGITNARMGWTNKAFYIADWQFHTVPDDQGVPVLGVMLQLRETSAPVYDITANEQQLIAAAPDSDLPNPFSVPTITGLVLSSGTAELFVAGDGTVITRIKASWTAVIDEFVTSGGRLEVQFKKSADSVWQPGPIVPGAETSTFIYGTQDEVNYDVRVRAVNALGVAGAYTTVTGHMVIGKSAAPSAPTSISVRQRAAGAVEVEVFFTEPIDWGTTELYRNTINDAGSAVKIDSGKRHIFTDLTAPVGSFQYYFARVVDTSGNASGFSPASNNGISVTFVQTLDIFTDAVTEAAAADNAAEVTVDTGSFTTLISVVVAVPADGAEFLVRASADIHGGEKVQFRLFRDTTLLDEGEIRHLGEVLISLEDVDTVETQAFDPTAFDPLAYQTTGAPTTPTYSFQAKNIGGGTMVAKNRHIEVLTRKR